MTGEECIKTLKSILDEWGQKKKAGLNKERKKAVNMAIWIINQIVSSDISSIDEALDILDLYTHKDIDRYLPD